jgi:Glycosyl hydrolases family 38 N-terminal domain
VANRSFRAQRIPGGLAGLAAFREVEREFRLLRLFLTPHAYPSCRRQRCVRGSHGLPRYRRTQALQRNRDVLGTFTITTPSGRHPWISPLLVLWAQCASSPYCPSIPARRLPHLLSLLPQGFNFGGDDNCPPIIDDPESFDYNVPDVVARFESLIDSQTQFTAGTDTMIMMATDFSGENAETWYRNVDKLIKYVNAHGKYNVLYSIPAYYTASKTANVRFPLRTEDVMPYADDGHAFWSGYFTVSFAE